MDDLRYPIGKFTRPASLPPAERIAAINRLAELPNRLRAAIHGFTSAQFDTPYRDGGWSVRQTVHHVADSHMQAFCRMRLALTEDWPAVLPYQEKLWAELEDSRTAPVETSLQLLEALHTRWVAMLQSLGEEEWSGRGYRHSESGKQTIEQVTALYAWHGRHHTAHITNLRKRMGW